MLISDEHLRGKSVLGADGKAIGEVVGITLDSEGWQIASLQVRLRRGIGDHLGMPHKRFSSPEIDIPRQALQSVGDAVILSISVDSLRELAGVHAEPEAEAAPAH